LRFHVATESAWDAGCGSAAVLAAGIASSGASLAWVVLLALPATACQIWVLQRYYHRHAPPA
jgi:hypothetical protein